MLDINDGTVVTSSCKNSVIARRVHVFTRSSNVWNHQSTLTSQDPELGLIGDTFGIEVSIDGDRLAGSGGCVNGTGWSAVLTSTGRARLSEDTLRFDVYGVNPLSFALLASADNALPNAGVCPPGSGIASPLLDGLRCVGGGLQRHGVRQSLSSGQTAAGWGVPDGPLGA